MRNQFLRPLLSVPALFLFLFPSFRSTGEIKGPPAPVRPRLILILVIDQFRYDYLVRFRPQFVDRGFNLLLGGANFVNCQYRYATTATCPGHASLFTGAYPNTHGIVGNDWYDASAHRRVYCVDDPEFALVGASGQGFSPRNLIGSTLGDELRMSSNFQSKVVSISLKDRASVIPGGHTANAAYWYDTRTGHFVTSTYYMPTLPDWVAQFNREAPARAYCGKAWQALAETPGAGRGILSEFKPTGTEPCPNRAFLSWLNDTPFMNEIELDFAWETIRNEHLGQGPAIDLLAVSLSANDYVGHRFGPYSAEVADTTLRTDRYLAEFLKELDRTIGLSNIWIALAADHGVAPNPRFIKEHHLGLGNAQIGRVKDAVEQALSGTFGQDEWVDFSDSSCVYLSFAALKRHGIEPTKAEAVAAEAARSVPGVEAAFTRTQLLASSVPGTPAAAKVLNSFNPRRSGDILIVLEPFAVPVEGDLPTTHGEPWTYDSQVPLVLWGSAFKPGIYPEPCEPIDLAPTLAAALGITQPSGAQGRTLVPALK